MPCVAPAPVAFPKRNVVVQIEERPALKRRRVAREIPSAATSCGADFHAKKRDGSTADIRLACSSPSYVDLDKREKALVKRELELRRRSDDLDGRASRVIQQEEKAARLFSQMAEREARATLFQLEEHFTCPLYVALLLFLLCPYLNDSRREFRLVVVRCYEILCVHVLGLSRPTRCLTHRPKYFQGLSDQSQPWPMRSHLLRDVRTQVVLLPPSQGMWWLARIGRLPNMSKPSHHHPRSPPPTGYHVPFHTEQDR